MSTTMPSARLAVYVPVSRRLRERIEPRSAVVGPWIGTANLPDSARVDFEGDPTVPFRDRVVVAAGRHLACYPTIAQAVASRTELALVGIWDHAACRLDVVDADALTDWLSATGGRGDPTASPATLDDGAAA